MEGKLIASYRRELSALDDLQCAGTVTYTLTTGGGCVCHHCPARRGAGDSVYAV